MSSLKKQKSYQHQDKECCCNVCQFTKTVWYYYKDYVLELTKKINELDITRNKEIKEIELEKKKGKNIPSLNLEIENIKRNYDLLINSISDGYFYYNTQKHFLS